MMKKIMATFTSIISMLVFVAPVFAHAVVKPGQAGVAAYTDFTLGVPSEKDVATTGIKLMIPAGVNSVTPIVKAGWKIEVINSTQPGEPDDDGNVSPIPEAIVWSGGSVPAHQKDFFMFSTQVPSKETELDWKVEQTYADGSVISWTKSTNDQPKDEKGNPDFSKFGPYSKTMVVNDLKGSSSTSDMGMMHHPGSATSTDKIQWFMLMSGGGLILSLISIGMQMMRRK